MDTVALDRRARARAACLACRMSAPPADPCHVCNGAADPPTFEITVTKQGDGRQLAEVRIPSDPEAGVFAEGKALDGDLAVRRAKMKALDCLAADLEMGTDLPPAVEALFTTRIA